MFYYKLLLKKLSLSSMKEVNKIGHPLFILSLLILIINDWYFKPIFHNDLTGKLSDFSGLFAFSFFLGALFSHRKISMHIIAGLIFIIWNSHFSQPLIDYFNEYGVPLARTIDFSDNIALVSLIASYKCLKQEAYYKIKIWLRSSLSIISCLAFMATTLPPKENKKFVNIDREYQFEISKRELVSRLNMIQLKEVRRLNKSSGDIDFNSQTNVFHYNGRTDTLALILDYNNISDSDTIEFRTSYAQILITGNESKSKLKVLTLYRFAAKFTDRDYKKKAIKRFEKRIIKKLKKHR